MIRSSIRGRMEAIEERLGAGAGTVRLFRPYGISDSVWEAELAERRLQRPPATRVVVYRWATNTDAAA